MKFDKIVNEVLYESEELSEASNSKVKAIVKKMAKGIEDALKNAAKNLAGEELTDEEALKAMQEFAKSIEQEDLY
jgi:MinD-like ATPase involved in chromosome partitioning or flagellar assembly